MKLNLGTQFFNGAINIFTYSLSEYTKLYSLIFHFFSLASQASNNNLADVSAKDGSQETCVNLVASLVGVFLLSYTDVR